MGPVVPTEPVIIKAAKRADAAEGAKLAQEAARRAAKAEAEAKVAGEKQLADFLGKVEQETGKKIEKTPSG
jgi:hypothetical protein